MINFFWLIFWTNLIFLGFILIAIIGFIYVVFFSHHELTDEERKELLDILKDEKR